MPTEPSLDRDRTFRFGLFELSEQEGELRKSGVRIKLQEQPFCVLVELVSNAGKVVSREELQQKLWAADTFVDFDVGLNSAIRKLRKALNDDADNPHYIETLAKRGYRFIAPVANIAAASVPMTTGSPPVIDDSTPPILISAVSAPLSSASSGKAATLPDAALQSKPNTEHARRLKKRVWYWVLGASCGLALMIYGVIRAWHGLRTSPPLAIEQRITANPPEAPVTGAVVSPDGKYVAYSDTTGMYIRHIDSGETRPLELPKGFDAVPTSWFPDSAHLLLSVVERGGTAPSLWKVSVLGGSPQKMMENASEGVVSPDGSKIAFLRDSVYVRVYFTKYTGYARELWVVETNGNNPRRLAEAAGSQDSGNAASLNAARSDSGEYFLHLAWSPGGGRIAYFRVSERGRALAQGNDSVVLETIGMNGDTTKVSESSVQFYPALSWAADGRLLYAYQKDPRSELNDFGIWSVRVNEKTGGPEGEPKQLTKGVGRVGGLSVSADGKRLILWRVNAFPQVFLTEIDQKAGRLKAPHRLTLDDNRNMVTAWTPDSRAVLFYSNRSGTYKLFRQGIDQSVPEVLVEGSGIGVPRLNPDGTHILYLVGSNSEEPAHMVSVMEVPLEGGSPRLILRRPSIWNIQCARSPSKLCLLSTQEGSTTSFSSFDAESGKTEKFASFQVSEQPSWSLSPDGSQLALILQGPQRKVTFIKVANKSAHDVTLNEWPRLNFMDWDSDGKSVFVSSQTASGASVMLAVEPHGNRRVLLQSDKSMRYWWIIPSPDGRYGALAAVTGENNVWMVENF